MKTYIYTVYLIPGIKVGCTTELENRITDQSFDNYEILWQEEGNWDYGWIAGDKEIEFQLQYFNKRDNKHYQISREQRRRNASIGGNITGANNLTNRGIGGAKSQKIQRQCPYCNTIMAGPNYFRYHGLKCKMLVQE